MSISYLTTYPLSVPCPRCKRLILAGEAVTVILTGLHAYPPDPEEALLDDLGRDLGMLDVDFNAVYVEHDNCKGDVPTDNIATWKAANVMLAMPDVKDILSREYFALKLKKDQSPEEKETIRVIMECEDHTDDATPQARFHSEVETYTFLKMAGHLAK